MKGNIKQYIIPAGISRIKTILSVLVLTVLGGNIVARAQTLNVSIVDKIKAELTEANRGRLVAVPSESGTYTFEWYRSIDGYSWDKIERHKAATAYGSDYYNVSETGDWLDPSADRLISGVSDVKIRLIYKVKIVSKDGSAVGTEIISSPYRIPYYNELMNSGFEDLQIPTNNEHTPFPDFDSSTYGVWVSSDLPDDVLESNFFAHYNNKAYTRFEEQLIWKTTAQDGAIEVISASREKMSKSHGDTYETVVQYPTHYFDAVVAENHSPYSNSAFEGTQFVEINAEFAASLYQDVLTVPGSTLFWNCWHRARAIYGAPAGEGEGKDHIDKMRILCMDSKMAETLMASYANPSEAVRYALNHLSEFPGAVVSDMLSAGVYRWEEHKGSYVVPERQNLTRMFFVAMSGYANMGNMLDGVTFSNTAPQPQFHEAVLNIQKTISGVLTDAQASDLKSNLEFSISVDESTETLRGSDMLWKIAPNGDWIGTWSKRYDIDTGETKPYSVVEDKSSAEIPQLVLEYSDNGKTKGYLSEGETYDVCINNYYNNPIVIEKSGLKAGESAVFSVYDQSEPGKVVNVILTGKDNSGTTVSQKINVEFSTKLITVKELTWGWAYNASGSTEITQDITSSNGNVFTFTNVEKESTPLRDETIKNNAIINAREGVTVNEWEKANKRKL